MVKNNQHPLANTPEAIAKREERRKKHEEQKASEKEKQRQEENILHLPLSFSATARQEKKSVIEKLAENLRANRKSYLLDRDLKKTAVHDWEKEELAKHLNECQQTNSIYKCDDLSMAYVAIMVEMWKHPDKELNEMVTNFMDAEAKNGKVSIPFWMFLFWREFVPNDALRFLLTHADVFIADGASPYTFPKEIQRHFAQEVIRLTEAEKMKMGEKREKQINRVQNRLNLFTKLWAIYGKK